MLFAGLSSRGLRLGFRTSWKAGCKQNLFMVGRIHLSTLRAFLRSNASLPQQFALNCAVSDPSPTSPASPDDPVILSSKENPDGSILFMFGNSGQQVSEDVTVDTGLISKSEDDVEDAAVTGQNGSITSGFTDEKKETEAEAEGEPVSIAGAKSGGQLDSLASQDVTHEATQEDHTTDASATTPEELVESKKGCTAGAINKGEQGNDDEDNFRKKMDQLRELKRQMEELDKKYDSYFTVDYALKFAKKGFKDSDDEEYVDSSDADKSSLEVSGPGEISSSEDDDYGR